MCIRDSVNSNKNALSERDDDIPMIGSMMACKDTRTLVTRLAEVIYKRTQADGAYVSLLSETGEFMEFVAANGLNSSTLIGQRRLIDEGIIGDAWRSGVTVFHEDAAAQATHVNFEPGTQMCLVPMIVDDAVMPVVVDDSIVAIVTVVFCLLYTSPSPRDRG